MVTGMYLNIVVKDLEASKKFFQAIGFSLYDKTTDETAACVIFGDHMSAMLLTEDKMREFTNKEFVDTATSIEQITAFAVESRQEVEQMFERAIAAGATEQRPPQDYGFMYSRSFEDLDGHTWEVFYMDEAAAEQTFTQN